MPTCMAEWNNSYLEKVKPKSIIPGFSEELPGSTKTSSKQGTRYCNFAMHKVKVH